MTETFLEAKTRIEVKRIRDRATMLMSWLDAVADAQALPFADNSFANIVMVDVLHHIEQPARCLSEAERVLKPGRHVMLWTDKYIAAEARHQQWLRRVPGLQVVELFVWNKVRPGMGKRGRCTTEFLFILQKPPIRAKGFWADRGITDCWHESSDSSRHPHAKPIALTTRLIRCLTKSRDLVVDPAAGGYSILEACRATGREFLGGDLVEC